MKQQVELLQNKNNRFRMETESLVKVTELLSAEQINICEINGNTGKVITVKDTGIVCIRVSNPPQKHPPFSCQAPPPPLNLQTVHAPLVRQSPPYPTPPLKVRFLSERPKY